MWLGVVLGSFIDGPKTAMTELRPKNCSRSRKVGTRPSCNPKPRRRKNTSINHDMSMLQVVGVCCNVFLNSALQTTMGGCICASCFSSGSSNVIKVFLGCMRQLQKLWLSPTGRCKLYVLAYMQCAPACNACMHAYVHTCICIHVQLCAHGFIQHPMFIRVSVHVYGHDMI